MVFAVLAYDVSRKTRAAQAELANLRAEIVKLHEDTRILNAEWASLSRPERLHFLAERYFSELGLMQITAENYGNIEDVPLWEGTQESIPDLGTDIYDKILSDLLEESPK